MSKSIAHKKNRNGTNILLGRRVKAYWDGEESEIGWYDALVTNYDEDTRMHCLTYDIGTDHASEEWLCLDELIQKNQFRVSNTAPIDLSTIYTKITTTIPKEEPKPIEDKKESEEKGEIKEEDNIISKEENEIKEEITQEKSSPSLSLESKSSPSLESKSSSNEEEISRSKETSEGEEEEEEEDIIKREIDIQEITSSKEDEEIELSEEDEELCRKLMDVEEKDIPTLKLELNEINEKIDRIMDICIKNDFDLMSNDGEDEDAIFNRIVGVERLDRKRKADEFDDNDREKIKIKNDFDE